ncbi:MAG: pilus assembly protein PilW [Lysobacterales bacterium 14-68-21]|jgi:type IV pilus assembly protein PilW|nr:MAG: pilus assembly protein PilW [Xanthomonadales bacterium 15-68-25]OZB66773.1 MAG: pilus assembly protein PilW [Xanthomonadales bacterium 14-68-21]
MSRRPYPRRIAGQTIQRGLSLVELMIGMTIGLIMLAALGSLYVATSKARREFNQTSDQIENGRYALDMISRDVEMGGFYGRAGLSPSVLNSTVIDYSLPDLCATAQANMGFSSSTASTTVPVAVAGLPTTATTPTCLPNRLANTEILTVRYASSTPTATPSGTEFYVQLSNCRLDPKPLAYDSASTALVLQTKACDGTLADKRKYVVRTYYIADCDDCTAGDGIPTLKVAEFVNGAIQVTSLVSGIQDVHYSYGVDTDGNGAPDCYVDDASVDNTAACPNSTGYSWTTPARNWSNVTAVRINVLARNVDFTAGWKDTRTYDLGRATVDGPYNDRYKRHVYGTLARVWNIAGMREAP